MSLHLTRNSLNITKKHASARSPEPYLLLIVDQALTICMHLYLYKTR